MNNLFLAKTNPKETIIEHTERLLSEWERLQKLYPHIKYVDWELLQIACLYHDLGKMNTKFQNKLMKKLEITSLLEDSVVNVDEIPHGYLSPAFLPKKKLKKKFSQNQDKMRILYQSIYYHHKRPELENSEPIKKIVNEDLSKYIEHLDYNKIDISEGLYPSFVRYIKSRIPDDNDTKETTYQYFIVKGLLNRIDYAASAHIPVEEKNENLFEKTNEYLNSAGFTPNELQQYMIENQDKNNIIIASTGIGKTEASLFWIGNHKGFFTLPLRVSINAIYDRIKEKIGFKNIALLHSDTYAEYLKRNNDELDIDYYEKTKQLSMPLTVCTLDQLIDFIFKYEGFELKLATLSYSKLIIDEIQMYSPDLIAYLITALKYITDAGGKFSIVTATMPQIILDFMREEGIKFNEPVTYYKKVNNAVQLRHKVKVIEEQINIEHIIKNWKDKKVLVIANTVKKAQELYEQLNNELGERANINLFHSRFIKKDRAQKEKMILEMGSLSNKQTGIWITTQVVEASLDIDFDVLYTELSDISGLLQRMGRVFRNRSLTDGTINVYVYIGDDKRTSGVRTNEKSIVDHKIFDLSKDAIKKYDGKELNEEEKMQLVQQVYTKENLQQADYYKKIRETIHKVKNIKEYELDKSDVRLREIITNPVIPKCIYETYYDEIKMNLDIIKNSSHSVEKQKAKNKIRELVVDIPGYQFINARNNGYITDWIELDKYNQLAVIAYNYCFEKGITNPSNIDGFNQELQFV
ncbi:MAG: CRISPR-associated endonuclease/helicase Cas3 [Clostridiales bacterium]|nr:CRISPR-associated endonuclease/helicase Cas3 [Clostridiales bacterium]